MPALTGAGEPGAGGPGEGNAVVLVAAVHLAIPCAELDLHGVHSLVILEGTGVVA